MPEFSLTTIWSIPAPVEDVWACLVETETWPLWWKYVVAVEQTATGDSAGINNIRRFKWHTCLPYQLLLNLRVTEIRPFHFIAVAVTGDLQGRGCCQLVYQPASTMTQVEFQWHVQTCKPWMSCLTLLTRPIFVWNHNRVMERGEQDLIRYLATVNNSA
jgi:hypothetical protein